MKKNFWMTCWLIAIVAVFVGCQKSSSPKDDNCCPGGNCGTVVQIAWFYAEGCETCKQQTPEATEVLDGLDFKKLDVDYDPHCLAARNNVTATPTYIVFVNGKETSRANRVAELRKILESVANKNLQ